MKTKLPSPNKRAMIFEDNKLYACLASFPITKGHCVVVWKKKATDLHYLKRKDYDYLMDKVDEIRDALLEAFKIKKVYLVYADEINQVHWHLVPRYNEKGLDILVHTPGKLKDYSVAEKIRKNLK